MSKSKINLDTSKITDMVFDGIDHSDYPDFSDSFVQSANYEGRPMTDEELDWLNEEREEFVYMALMDFLF